MLMFHNARGGARTHAFIDCPANGDWRVEIFGPARENPRNLIQRKVTRPWYPNAYEARHRALREIGLEVARG